MKVEKEETISRSFVLTVDEIKRIVKHFNHADQIILRAVCNDGVTRRFVSVDELVKFENMPNKEIKTLRINVFVGAKKIAFIQLSNCKFDNVGITLDDEEDNVFKTMEYFEERFAAMEPWYGFIYKQGGYVVDFLIRLIFVLSLSKFFFSTNFDLSNNLVVYSVNIAILLILNMIVGWVWDRIKESAFPRGVFGIGQGVKRNQDKDVFRTAIVISSIVSLLISVAVVFMFQT